MKRRIIAMLICLSMVFSCVSVFGATPTADYLPGPIEQYQELGTATQMENASYNGETLTLNAGGKARYDFLMQFDAVEIHFTYEAREDVNLTVNTTDLEYNFVLPKNDTTATFTFEQQSGAMFCEFIADKTVEFSEIWYKKAKQQANIGVNDNAGLGWYAEIAYTPYQEALQTTIAIMEGSAAIKTKNLTRYIDFDDTTLTGRYIGDSYYLPINAISRGLDIYYEDYPEQNYAYISGNHFCVWQKDGVGYIEKGGKREDMSNFFIYQDGYTWVPVRRLAEIAEYTVLYKDGVIVIDNYVSAPALIENYDVFEDLKLELSSYIPEDTSGDRVFHVAKTPAANDRNPGTEAAPFETIQRAADLAKAGDTIIIHEGTYREKVIAKNSGTPSKPIKYMAAEGEEAPVISAFEEVSNFAPYKHPGNGMDIYIASLGHLEFESMIPGHWDIDRNFVLYKGKMLQEGKHPNSDTAIDREPAIRTDDRLKSADNPNGEQMFQYLKNMGINPDWEASAQAEWLPTIGDVRVTDILSKGAHKMYNHKITSDVDLNQEDDYWKGGVFYGMVGFAWQPCSIQISSSTKGSLIGSEYWTGATGSITYYVNKYATDYGMITHHLNTVDSAGEWYIDNEQDIMYIIPPSDADPENMTYEVKSRMVTFEADEKEYIHLYNINTRGGGINFIGGTGNMVNGGDHQYNTQFTISMVEGYNGQELYHRYDVVKNAYVSEEGRTLNSYESGEVGAINMTGVNNFIVNTYTAHQAGAGLFINGSYNYAENNETFITGWGCCYPAGIWVGAVKHKGNTQTGGHMIYQNTSTGACRAAFNGGGGPQGAPMYVAYNDFAWSNLLSRDTGLWYQYGTSGGTQLTMGKYHHNAVHDLAASRSDSVLTAMMYNDGYTGVYDVYDNMLYCTNELWEYQGQPYFSHGGTMCFDKSWGNYEAWYVDPEIASDFPVSYYPGSWPIDYGVRREGDEMFVKNYDRRRDDFIVNLANGELTDGAYVDNNGFVNFPTDEASVYIDDITLPASGAEMYVYYTSNKFEYNPTNVPNVWIELFDASGKSLGTISNRFFGHNEYRYMISRGVVYLPTGYETAKSMKITTDAENMKLANIGINPFDYEKENSTRTIPLDVQVIPGGSYERVDIFHGIEFGAPTASGHLTEKAGSELTYWQIGETRQNGFYYKDVKIGKVCDEILFAGSTNGTYGQTRLDIYLGSDMSGEKIAEVDCSQTWRKGQSWHYEVVRGTVFRELEPGTYDFYIKFNNTDDSLGPNGMSTNFGAVAFF